jgi:hypothetical protein
MIGSRRDDIAGRRIATQFLHEGMHHFDENLLLLKAFRALVLNQQLANCVKVSEHVRHLLVFGFLPTVLSFLPCQMSRRGSDGVLTSDVRDNSESAALKLSAEF